MWKYVLVGLLLGVGIFAGVYWYLYMSGDEVLSPARSTIEKITEKKLAKYSFENLRDHEFAGGKITLGEQVEEDSDEFDSYIFYFEVENLNDPEEPLRGSGLMNVPIEPVLAEGESARGEYPLIVQFRGFVPTDIFAPGEGTKRSGEYFASHGFITLAPDFLGYGESDMPSEDALEERFQTYTTALSLLASVAHVNEALEGLQVENEEEDPSTASNAADTGSAFVRWDGENIGIWGHSNGGHIALSALALSGYDYPTVLWNPVSKPFPYSIFYYTDEYDDNGRGLRRLIADFESEYDVELYSPPNYYEWIEAPIQLHQGLSDREILPWWSEALELQLEDEETDEEEVEYFAHPNADHNLMPGGWDNAVAESVDFYLRKFEERLENQSQ